MRIPTFCSGVVHFCSCAYVNTEMWVEFRSKCKCKLRNILQNESICIVIGLLIYALYLCKSKLILTAVVTVILVNVGII